MIDIASHLKAIHREVGNRPTESGEVVFVSLRRRFNSPIEEVWDAVTRPERMQRWFLPISGTCGSAETFQLEGTLGATSSSAPRPACSG